jgi:predicted nucleotidyltransferase
MDVGLVVVAGSKAYGLDTPDSDTDYRGFFEAPAHLLVGVNDKRPKDSWTRTDPDITLHEVGKFVSLALAANPTVLEVLAIDPEVSSPLADDLRANLDAFLSDRCRATFGGYAMAQFNRLKNRGDGSFSADTRKRTAKHARHMLRLLQQGAHLLETGELRVMVPNREELFEFGELPLEAMVTEAEDAFARFNAVESVLPATPNIDLIHQILVDHRLGRRRSGY